MARQRKGKEKEKITIKLAQPDRSGPSEATLLDLADERGLFEQAEERSKKIKKRKDGDSDDDDEGVSPGVERVLEALLWSFSLDMLHFTLDVLVQRQFAIEIEWDTIAFRTGWGFLVFTVLFYTFHPHPSSPILLPGLPAKYQHHLRQAIFFAGAVVSGCYMIYLTNVFSYLYVMKRTPTLGCLWVWCVIELELTWAVLSLLMTGVFLVWGGYSVTVRGG